jgi:hypothetical protein
MSLNKELNFVVTTVQKLRRNANHPLRSRLANIYVRGLNVESDDDAVNFVNTYGQ